MPRNCHWILPENWKLRSNNWSMSSSPADPHTASEPSDKRRWNAFVCQDCRGIFRIPSDYEGRGVVCPNCDRMLRMPLAGEPIPPLVESLDATNKNDTSQEVLSYDKRERQSEVEEEYRETTQTPTPFSPQPSGGQVRRRKKHRDRSKDPESDWDQKRGRKVQFSRRIPLYWWWGTTLLALSIVVTILLALKQEKVSMPPADPASVFATPVTIPILDTKSPDEASKLHFARLTEGYAVIDKFCFADGIETIMSLLRPSAGLKEKVRRYYENQPFPKSVYKEIDKSTARFLSGYQVLQVMVALKEQAPRLLTLVRVGNTYRVDWESWVGWSEMDLTTLKKNKPTRLTEVRVTVEMVSYYNYDFPTSSEAEWQSYRLIFAQSEEFLHGYIERSSPVNDAVRLASDQNSRQMTLRIRYRDASSHPSQVLIDSVSADGWVTELPQE